ncbi:hypothetical protein [Streptomyces sp. NPDC007063]|uniref:hypothetical protein n=1 Tax=Streptomyces sp. NPDC007063 TaxID=3364772 RepID=UPI0036ADDC8B
MGRKVRLSDVFNLERWNRALSPEIFSIALGASAAAARLLLSGLGLSADEYSEDRTQAWLEEHAAGVASGINGATQYALGEALAAGLVAGEVQKLFTGWADARAPQIARTEVTAAQGFGIREAAQQAEREMTKTWATGSNPRSSHARMNGETVAMGAFFSNGARWPGDSLLDDKERANCNCSMRVDLA